ncbi:biotin carboxylase N-terminal domain-containing protein [Chelatococcus sp.]|uniref:acetyl/propionyl/methylcrotonyl-CoA carboxylase subunit alpha n=2 Tax=unclassified Chelatococcus TaxID=2638111 RepID=UPI0025B8B066|nr:biotin carboxylase N-terminal domain-containing protein [Chelatococcus sp.]MCO5078891.1 ATP-grasp domain-containing protein [Chelatococcus sp.]
MTSPTIMTNAAVLIANRGEIACRIIRTARCMGLRTIAVYSEADAGSLFVRMADEAHCIGPAPARESYLNISAIIDVARRTGAAFVHPGYGFLSERAEFAEACAAAGVTFVGPPASAIRAMGLKDAAKALVAAAGVPVVPGYHGERQEPDFLGEKAAEIGYPVLIKAVAGGGGKGMKRVDAPADFAGALESAQREAAGAFGDPRVLIEKYVLAPRHIEIQVFADTHGHVVHLFERDCSLQRRHQKVIEEAPAPGMPPETRQAMGDAAVQAARAVGYVGAGTVEFIVDASEGLKPDRFYFMEMNTRLQVEHPVTEAITGLDLVELQLRVAAGEALPFDQGGVAINGHAVEARVYAEDPEKGFLPSTGHLWALRLPTDDGLRVDTGVEAGDEVSPFYDPMIAKVIAHGATRDEALDRLAGALGRSVIAGPRTNLAFLKKLCEAPAFRAGHFDTGFIERNLDSLGAVPQPVDAEAVRRGVLALLADHHDDTARKPGSEAPSPWDARDAFQLMGPRRQGLSITVDGERIDDIGIEWLPAADQTSAIAVHWAGGTTRPAETGTDGTALAATPDGVLVIRDARQTRVGLHDPFSVDLDHLTGGSGIAAPMHGKLVAMLVVPGDTVKKGQRLAVVEAMKMEHVLTSSFDGTVTAIHAAPGEQVAEGASLILLEPLET